MNFCIENIGTTIVSSQVESDGHEAKNLLEKDPGNSTSSSIVFQSTKKRGFLADYFVRTPVTLSIKFPLCIEISHIVINPKFGAQTSSAFTIETLTSYKVWKLGEETAISKFLVAKEFFNNSVIPRRIVFRNPRFVPRHPFALLSKSSEDSNGEIVFNLKHPSLNACERVIGLDVTILRSVGSSVPGLGAIEVWGQPCVRCPQESVQKLLVTWLRRTRKTNSSSSSSTPPIVPSANNEDDDEDCSPTFVKRRKLSKNVNQEVLIPEEFLDSLTFEIMCQPIRLPCGITVDATTLQRFYKEEAIFGRPPSDPFTGNTYTQNVKPIADTALKIRIDQFVTKNSAHSKNSSLQNLPRTVGTGSQGFSKAVCKDLGLSMTSNNRPLIHNNFNISATSTSSSNSSNSSTNVNTMTSTVNLIPEKTKPSTATNEIQTETSSSSSSKMEDRLQKELAKIFGAGDDNFYLIKSATTTNDTTTTTTEQGMAKTCVQCRTNFENDFSTVIYTSTSCPHILICRSCVLKLPKQGHQKCATCNRDWNVQDLERIHSRS